jgi:Arc/MetJ-type ribon-helix-helix transcriptional regulator
VIQRKLESGQYHTPQEVLESALQRLDQDEVEFGWGTAELQAAVDVGWEQAERGDTMTGEEARTELARLRAERRRG